MKRGLNEHLDRGGRLQRIARAKAVAASSSNASSTGSSWHIPVSNLTHQSFDSEVVNFLVYQWAWGHMSATKVQQIAHVSYNDQIALLQKLNLSYDNISTSLKKFASLGTWGKNPANCHDELLKYLGEPETPKPIMQDVTLKIPKPQPGCPTEQTRQIPIFFFIFGSTSTTIAIELNFNDYFWATTKHPTIFLVSGMSLSQGRIRG